MSKHIEANDISSAWLGSMDHLLTVGGRASNLMVTIKPEGISKEVEGVRERFDVFLQSHASKRVRPIAKVADTIFPSVFYIDGPNADARNHLYKMQRLASRVERRCIYKGTYFDRLIDWPGVDSNNDVDAGNQLERHIQRLSANYGRKIRNHSNYELAIITPNAVGLADAEDTITDCDGACLRIQDPVLDPYKAIMSFPCLSHISLTLFEGRLDMTALYRSQHFMTKAYGNFVGLSNLLLFITAEVGCGVGELTCIATHANAEIGGGDGFRRADVTSLVNDCWIELDAKTDGV